jgi:hypothetical protein
MSDSHILGAQEARSAGTIQHGLCTSLVHWLHQGTHFKRQQFRLNGWDRARTLAVVIKFKTQQSQHSIPFHSAKNIVAGSKTARRQASPKNGSHATLNFSKPTTQHGLLLQQMIAILFLRCTFQGSSHFQTQYMNCYVLFEILLARINS